MKPSIRKEINSSSSEKTEPPEASSGGGEKPPLGCNRHQDRHENHSEGCVKGRDRPLSADAELDMYRR